MSAQIKSGYTRTPIFDDIELSAQNYSFYDTYSMVIGERKDANITIKPRKRLDWRKRGRVDMMDAELDIIDYQVGLQQIYNYLLLFANGPVNARFRTGSDQKWANFVENIGNNLGSPVGTGLLGGTFDYICSDTERSINSKLMGGMFLDNEYRYFTQQDGAGLSGGTGGSIISGFVHTHYNVNDVGAPGILSIAVGTDNFINIADGSSFGLSFTPLAKKVEPWNRPQLAYCELKTSIIINNDDLANTQQALAALFNTDTTFTIQLPPTRADILASKGNQTFVLSSSCFIDAEIDEKETSEFTTKVEFTGFVPIDHPAWAGTNIAVNIATNTMTFNGPGAA